MECLSKKIKLSIDFPRRKAHPFKKGMLSRRGHPFFIFFTPVQRLFL